MERKPLFVWDFFGVVTEEPAEAGLVMDKVKEIGGKNIIVSNTPPDYIQKFLKKEKLSDKVEKIVSAIGQDKNEVLKDYLNTQRPSKIVVVGDSWEEIEAGQSVGAITYSYRNPALEQKADFLIKNLIELLDEARE